MAIMKKYLTYPEYYYTDDETLEKLPQHWMLKQVRYLLKNGSEGTKIGPFGSALKLEDMVDDGVQVYGQENVIKRNFSLGKRNISFNRFKEMKVYEVFSGDILITMMGTNGKCDIVPSCAKKGIIDSHLLRVRVNNELITPNFFKMLVDGSPETKHQIIIQSKGSIMLGLNSSIVKNLYLPLPEISEQQIILSFLDYETTKIDNLIEKQQLLIELLKEKRQAVIGHAVTKGLKLDVPMKDSGVEWLGEVPIKWEVKRFNHVLKSIGDVDHYMPQSVDTGIPYVMTGDLENFASDIEFENCKQVSRQDYLNLTKKTKSSKGDVIMARYATIGTASYIDIQKEFLVSYSCVTIKPCTSIILGLYLYYYMKSDSFLRGIKYLINANTQENIGIEALKKISIAFPIITEQEKIITELQTALKKLDDLLDKTKEAIKLIQERRTALISSAVTGKIDVRDWIAPETSATHPQDTEEETFA